MHRSRSLGGNEYADCAAVLGLADRHQRGVFLVTRLDERRCAVRTPECVEEAIDAVAAVAVDPRDPPVLQPPHDDVRNCESLVLAFLRHRAPRGLGPMRNRAGLTARRVCPSCPRS